MNEKQCFNGVFEMAFAFILALFEGLLGLSGDTLISVCLGIVNLVLFIFGFLTFIGSFFQSGEVKEKKGASKEEYKGTTSPNYCSYCGTKALPETKFCSNCGKEL